ncbi:MAG: hypothetical protein AB3N64_00860 [Puniceicoccaceae bacterium]
MNSNGQEKGKAIQWIILLGLVVYTLAFTFSYVADPMALSPQLDAKENLTLASQFDAGSSAPEPFYRAVLYPYILSLIATEGARPLIALLIGLGCHLGNAFMVYWLAGWIWQRASAKAAAAALYLLNPASLFFSLQVLDMTMGTSLFLGGLILAINGRERLLPALVSGLVLGLCVLVRPHFLPVTLLVPAVMMLLSGWKVRLPALGWLTLAVVLLSQGVVNYTRSGEFRILPWQGGYNLYAANRPGANGLYYKQSVDVSGQTYLNPARAESEQLYQQATGATPPFDIDDVNSYWRQQTITTVLDDPARWLQLMFFKGYAILNSAEQYNNLTFSYHKARFPLLRFNPMNWGILVILGTLGCFLLIRRDRLRAGALVLLILGYSAALLLYYASARFRLPLVPLMAILSSGVFAYPKDLRASWKVTATTAILAGISGFLAYSSFGSIRSTETYVQDKLLMANANAELGDDVEAARYAHNVLWDYPERREALRIYTVSYFNLRLTESPGAQLFGDWDLQKQWVIQFPPTDPVQDVILGVYFWQWGELEKATLIWKSIRAQGGPGANLAGACLAASGTGEPLTGELSALQEAVARLLHKPNPAGEDS